MNQSDEPTGTTGKWTPELMAAHKARIEFMEAMGQAHYSRTDAQWHVAHYAKTVGAELEAENAKLRAEVEAFAPIAGRVVIQACTKCHAEYPQFSVLSSMTCPQCEREAALAGWERAQKQLEDANLQVSELRNWVLENGHHESECAAHSNQKKTSCEGPCDCGWAAIKVKYAEKRVEPS